ncbi:hypothetical protein ACIRRA_38610 [Nocardia sp. NPDC101769]|uniref:hypothetical protein n=1 Tax=Nocardia sp. NPDC101769 TaxID=3364333 RepID=UPI0038267ACF
MGWRRVVGLAGLSVLSDGASVSDRSSWQFVSVVQPVQERHHVRVEAGIDLCDSRFGALA